MSRNKIDNNIFIDLLIKHAPDSITLTEQLTQDDRKNLSNLFFLNKHTLQLNRRGLTIFSQIFESHCICLPEEYKIKSNDLITLDRECKLPYYIHTSAKPLQTKHTAFLVVFERELAMILKLYDGDIDMIRDMPRDGIF